MPKTDHNIIWLGAWSNRYTRNARYYELLCRLSVVKQFRLPYLKFVPSRCYNVLQQLLLPALSCRYEYYYCINLPSLRYFHGSVVVDIDDPRFTDEEIKALNDPRVVVVVTTTDLMKEQLSVAGVHKPMIAIPSGYSQRDLNPAKWQAIAQKYNPWNRPVVGYMSYIMKYKSDDEHANVDLLIEAMEIVWRDRPEVELWLLGGGDMALKSYAEGEPRVRLLGLMPHHHLVNWIKNFTVATYCRTKDWGGRSAIKLIEYMGCGIPIIATRVTEAQIVAHANAGMLVQTAADFGAAILMLLENPSIYRKFADNATAFSSIYDWDSLAERYGKEVLGKYCT